MLWKQTGSSRAALFALKYQAFIIGQICSLFFLLFSVGIVHSDSFVLDRIEVDVIIMRVDPSGMHFVTTIQNNSDFTLGGIDHGWSVHSGALFPLLEGAHEALTVIDGGLPPGEALVFETETRFTEPVWGLVADPKFRLEYVLYDAGDTEGLSLSCLNYSNALSVLDVHEGRMPRYLSPSPTACMASSGPQQASSG